MYKILIRGSEGKDVIELQNQLATEGYLKDAVDGVFGIRTGTALQRKTGRDWMVCETDEPIVCDTLADSVVQAALKRLTTPLKYERDNWIDKNILGPFKPLLYSNKQILDHTDGRFSWCASWVHYCVRQVVADFPMRPAGHWGVFASVRAWKHAGELAEAFKKIQDAVPGDLVIYDWANDSVDDHIGIFHSHRGNSGTFLSLEGNASNAEAVKIREQSAVSCVIDTNLLLSRVSRFS